MNFSTAWERVLNLNRLIGVTPEVRAHDDQWRVKEISNGWFEVSEDAGETASEVSPEALQDWLAEHSADWK